MRTVRGIHNHGGARQEDGETMTSIEEREKNLYNATDTLAQFYDEIESFMGILSGKMERLGYPASEERLRSGTFGIRNLPRRLLASAMVMFVKSIDDTAEDDETEEEPENEGGEVVKAGKRETDDYARPEDSIRESVSVFPKNDSERADAGITATASGCLGRHAFCGEERRGSRAI